MSEEIKTNELAEETLDNVSGGAANTGGVNDKKGTRKKTKIKQTTSPCRWGDVADTVSCASAKKEL